MPARDDAALFVLRENYPFSHFPMYSSFSSSTYFLYLTEASGSALHTRRFGLTSTDLKKIFENEAEAHVAADHLHDQSPLLGRHPARRSSPVGAGITSP
jgi:hypothetical protein